MVIPVATNRSGSRTESAKIRCEVGMSGNVPRLRGGADSVRPMSETHFDEHLQRQLDRIARMQPEGMRVWDAHTHLGVDEDGFTLTPEELMATMREQGIERAFTFPLNDPERRPAYRVRSEERRVGKECRAG